MTDRGRCLLDNRQAEAGQRFGALSALFNPSTFRHMERLGISPGWRVWEVGAGGPSVPAWLADRVGPDGCVLATDIDTSWLGAGSEGSYHVLRHDAGTEPAPAGGCDLVHTRLVMVHVPECEQALESMIRALRPGGWLLLEEADPGLQDSPVPMSRGAGQLLANRLKRAFRALLAERGADLAFGRTLSRRLRQGGLAGVQSDAYFPWGGRRTASLSGPR